MSTQKHIVFLGASGFPFGLASVQRQKLMAMALTLQEWKVTVVSPRSIHDKKINVKRVGRIDRIKYVYAYNPIRKNNFFVRNIQKMFSPISEFIILYSLKKKYGIHSGVVSTRNSFRASMKYFVFSILLNFSLAINFVEIYKGRKATPLSKRINDYLFNNYGIRFYQKYLPISNYIMDYFKLPKLKSHLIPILVDSEKISRIYAEKATDKCFLFCGSAAYFDSIDFALHSMKLLNNKNCKLILVVNGSKNELERINLLINKYELANQVKMLKNLSDYELYCYYKTSIGLLLPLFDTLQDKARFPHKLAEYLASGTIVLSNPIGEINLYLSDNENSLLSKSGDANAFSKKMQWVLDHPKEAGEMGSLGKLIATHYFDYKKVSHDLSTFLIKKSLG